MSIPNSSMKKHCYFNLILSRSRQSSLHKDGTSFNPSTSSPNLFKQSPLPKSKPIKIEPDRTYDYVGVRELKSYYDRVWGRVKESKRMNTSRFGGQMVSAENKGKEDSNVLDKFQLLLSKSVDASMNEVALNVASKDYQKQNDGSNILFQSRMTNASSSTQYSLQKVKNIHKNYEQLWEKDERACCDRTGLPSIMQSISEERSKAEKKEQSSLSFHKNNLNCKWESMLRDGEMQQKQTYRKILTAGTKITKSMNLRGRQKLSAETQWVHRKGDSGFHFKLLRQITKRQ